MYNFFVRASQEPQKLSKSLFATTIIGEIVTDDVLELPGQVGSL